MKIRITDVEFDFDDDYGIDENTTEYDIELGVEYMNKITNSVINKVYSVDDESEIADIISDETGWCVVGIEYEFV